MASTETIMSSIDLWPLSWAPDGWMLCQGQLLSVNQYQALYSLIANTFGGNYPTTFAIPDMRGRVPIGSGVNQSTQTNFPLAGTGGVEKITLQAANVPAHTHVAAGTVNPKAGTGKITLSSDPTNNYPGQTASTNQIYTSASNAVMGQSPVAVTVQPNTGGNQPFAIFPPYVVLNYMIAITGYYPTRP